MSQGNEASGTKDSGEACCSQLVEVAVKRRHFGGKTLALADRANELGVLGSLLKGVANDNSPVVEHALREGLAGGLLAEIAGEAKGLRNREMCLDLEDGSANTLLLLDNASTAPVQASVDSTHSLLGACDVHKIDGLQKTRLSSEAACVHATTGSGHDLTGAAMDGVGVHGDIQQVPADTAAVLLGENTFLGGNLETTDNGVLDFAEVPHGLGGVDDKVGAGGLGAESPDLAGVVDVPLVLLVQDLGASLLLITRGMVPFSISSVSSSARGEAVMYKRLCLLGDLARQIWSEVPMTVSR